MMKNLSTRAATAVLVLAGAAGAAGAEGFHGGIQFDGSPAEAH